MKPWVKIYSHEIQTTHQPPTYDDMNISFNNNNNETKHKKIQLCKILFLPSYMFDLFRQFYYYNIIFSNNVECDYKFSKFFFLYFVLQNHEKRKKFKMLITAFQCHATWSSSNKILSRALGDWKLNYEKNKNYNNHRIKFYSTKKFEWIYQKKVIKVL